MENPFQNSGLGPIPSAPAAAPTPAAQPSASAPQSGGGGGDITQQLQKILQTMAQPRQQVAPPPVSAKASKPSLGKDIAMQALTMFVPFVGGAVQRASKAAREQQITDVVGKMQQIDNELETAQYISGGDLKKMQEYLDNSPFIKGVMADKKFLKGMQKVYGSDLLNPDKQNTVFHEGMKRHLSLKKSKEEMKQTHGALEQHKAQASSGGEMTGSQFVDKLPQRTVMPDASKLSALDNAQRRDTQGETSLALRLGGLEERVRENKAKDTREDKKIENAQDYKQWAEKHADATASEHVREFEKTLEFKKWKENEDVATRVRIGTMQLSKPSSTLQPVAIFSRTGLHQLEDAEDALDKLEKKGVLSGVASNKMEEWLFGKGLADPTLDAESRRLIGKVRSAMTYTSSAAMRAHTGRTSREIYDDFKQTLGIGQDKYAIRGAMEQTHSMLTEYADVVTPEAQRSLREPVKRGSQTPEPKGKVYKKGEAVPPAE